MKRACRVLIIAALLMLFAAAQVFAVADYEYQIQVFPGNRGEFAGGEDPMVIPIGKYGDWYNLDINDLNVQVTDSKYYVKGLRETGTDNSDASIVQSVTAQADRDLTYVVAYGIKGSMVKYTVKYQDSTGAELLPPSEYYGSVGDKPVISFKYIEGYLPNAYNETKTLTDNEADNQFVFIYKKTNVEPVPVVGDTQDTQTPTKNSADGKTTTRTVTRYVTSPAGRAAAGQAAAVTNQNNNQNNDQNGQTGGQTEIADNETPAALVDLDDNDVPLASAPGGNSKGAPGILPVLLGIGGAILIGLLVLFFVRRKRRMEAA